MNVLFSKNRKENACRFLRHFPILKRAGTGFKRCKTPKIKAGLLAVLTSFALLSPAAAQQREIINPSFEDGPNPAGFLIHSDNLHPGWTSTNGEMETWVDGFQQRDAQEGSYLVELNPNSPVGLYQEICLINGEQLNWDFYHAARGATGGTNQTILYEVRDSSDGLIQLLETNTVAPMGSSNDNQTNNLWENVTGNTIYNGPSGVQRLQFRSTNPGSAGNFLDNINIEIIPLITFDNITTSNFEGDSSDLPFFTISGVVPTTFDIQFSITGGTATQGADYTVGSNTITVPAGTYDGTSAASIFNLPITILQDTIVDDGETIEITYNSIAPASAGVLGGPNCTDAVTVGMHTILDLPLIEAVPETFAPIVSGPGGATGSVLGSDTLNAAPVTLADVNITVGASDPELSLDPLTGLITVAPTTASGTYTVEYTICEDGDPTNCATVTETVTVVPFIDVGRPANPTGVCNWNWNYWNSGGPDDNPTGGNRRLDPSLRIFTQDDDWYATDITPNAAHSLADNVAPPQITGTNSEWERAYGVGYFVAPPGSTQTIDLTDAGAFEGHALAFFDSSGTQFGRFPAANGSYIASTNNAAHVDANGIQVPPSSTGTTTFTVPADGQYYIHYIWADEDNLGNFYTTNACQPLTPSLDAEKTVSMFGTSGAASYALPGNDVIYSISVSNSGTGPADEDSIELIDVMPPEVSFWNGDIDTGGPDNFSDTTPVAIVQTAGTGLTFDYNTDVRFGFGTTAPSDFNSCTPLAPDGTYRDDVTFICFNPKGFFNGGTPAPSFSLNFRARIN